MGSPEEGMKGAALMTVMIFFMFLPQWYFKWAVPKEMVRTQPQPSTHKQFSSVLKFSSARGNCRSGYRRERPNREAAAAWRRPPPLTSFGSTRAASSDVSAPTPWRTRPGRSRATPFEVARPDAPSPQVAQPEYTGRIGRRILLGRCDTMPSRSNPSQPPWRCADAVLPPCLTR